MGRNVIAAAGIVALLDFFRRLFTAWRPTTPRGTFIDAVVCSVWELTTGQGVVQGVFFPLTWPLAILYARPDAWAQPPPLNGSPAQPREKRLADELVHLWLFYFMCTPFIDDVVAGWAGMAGTVALIALYAIGLWVYREAFVWVYARVLDPQPTKVFRRPRE